MKPFLLVFACTMAASAGEYAVLSNGFRIHADAHSSEGSLVRLQTERGVIEVPAGSVLAFETEEYTPPPPPAPVAAAPVSAPSENLTPRELITRAAERVGLPPEIVHSVARAESAYRPNAISPKGAIGLMQLMPGTAAALNADPHDPAQNADAGALYLRQLLERYDGDPHQVSKAIAAYNAGPGAVDRYHGVPPYRETVQYVRRVLRQYEKEQKKKIAGSAD
jgi:soluble lytic murein transglycosylase-like protein